MYGDTNGDGQLSLNEDDPPSTPSLASSTPITVPVVETDSAASASAIAQPNASISSNDLVAIQIDAYAGPNAQLTLTAVGAGEIQAWLDPQETQPINLAAGATFTGSQIPNEIWINGEQAGNVQLNAVLDLDNALAQAAQPQQGAAPAQAPQAPQPQQVGQAGVNLMATQAAVTTAAIGHSAWAFATAQSAATITQGGINQSCLVAAVGCTTLVAGAGALSPQGQIMKAGLPTVNGLPVMPGWVWNPMNDPPPQLGWEWMSNQQAAADNTPNSPGAFVFQRPNNVAVGPNPWQWPATPPVAAGWGPFAANCIIKFKIVMQSFTDGLIQNAITNMQKQAVASWNVNFLFDPNGPVVISRNEFLFAVFGSVQANDTVLNIGADVKVTLTMSTVAGNDQLSLKITAANGGVPQNMPQLEPGSLGPVNATKP